MSFRRRKKEKPPMKRIPELLKNALVGVAIVGSDGKFIDINDKFCDILGYSKDRLLQLTFQEITHPDDLSPDVNSFRRVMAGELPGYTMHKRYMSGIDPSVYIRATLLVKGYYDADGAFSYFVSQIVASDATTITNAEQLQIDEILAGIDNGEFCLHYQPIVSVETGETVAYEGLSRWRHPSKGLIYPGYFLPLLKMASASEKLCHSVIKTAGKEQPLLGKKVAININPLTVGLPDWGKWANKIGDDLYLEILESEPTCDFAQSRLQVLRDRGIEIALDDFGTGYANYEQLDLVDVLKIDASLVRNIENNRVSFYRCSSIVQLAHSMVNDYKPRGLRAIAEGVETQEQLDALEIMRCDYAQGYLFSKPRELSHWVAGPSI